MQLKKYIYNIRVIHNYVIENVDMIENVLNLSMFIGSKMSF